MTKEKTEGYPFKKAELEGEAKTNEGWAEHLRNTAKKPTIYSVITEDDRQAMLIGAEAILGEGPFFCLNCCEHDELEEMAEALSGVLHLYREGFPYKHVDVSGPETLLKKHKEKEPC